MLKYLIFLLSSYFVHSRPVILSSGLGNYTDQQLLQQYTSFKAYNDIGLITGTSMLIYNLNEDGSLGMYNTSSNMTSEQFQSMLKINLGLKAYPCLYCDATIGMCSNLSSRLDNLYKNIDSFITNTILTAKMYNWDGYYVDFEPDTMVNSTQITNFILLWANQLNAYNLQLNLWIGGNAPYDNRIYGNNNLILTTMNTYGSNYNDFIQIAAQLQVSMFNITKLGFGLLTNYGTIRHFHFWKTHIFAHLITEPNKTNAIKYFSNDANNIKKIINWSILTKSNSLSLWASHISPSWYYALCKYVNS